VKGVSPLPVRQENRPALRRRILLGTWLLAAVVIIGRSVELQVVEGAAWRDEADRQHRRTSEVPAARGSILDRDGVPLAVSHETFRVSVAPGEVQDREGTAELLAQAMELSKGEAQRVLRSGRRWVVLPGRYPPSVREALAGARGVYVERELRRFHPHGELMAGVLGAVVDGMGVDGIENSFETILAGFPGQEVVARDSRGRPIPGEAWEVRAPLTGGEVVLTLDVDLQEIAQEALSEALERTRASGGDLLVTDPNTGEILAMASVRDGRPAGLTALNSPYEPGSTLKPFTVAAMLAHGVAALGDSVDTEQGSWRIHGRTITDVKRAGRVDLAHALRVSSNVGIAKLAQGLTPGQQYESLRDFGFGTPPGLPIPSEASGRLRRPDEWSKQSGASLSIGYEVSVTPVQMAMAYGALANGGILMEPRLIREIRGRNGEVLQTNPPRAVRRVVPREVTDDLRQVLVDVVEEGTGTAARLTTFSVAGKSGTSRAYSPKGGYAAGEYFASFVGFFPAENPQLVVFVKLDSPRGAYYGGATAAPVTRATLEAVLAARRPPIDRRALAVIAQRPMGDGDASVLPSTGGGSPVRPASLNLDGPSGAPAVQEDWGNVIAGGTAVEVPEVRGLAPRTAVRRLHSRGFHVVWEGIGPVRGTMPRAGTRLVAGDTVRLVSAGGRDD